MSSDERHADHDERIERLEQLAKKVFGADFRVEPGYGDNHWVVCNDFGCPLSVSHPDALEAFEAALRTLAWRPPPLEETIAMFARHERELRDVGLGAEADDLARIVKAMRERAKGEP